MESGGLARTTGVDRSLFLAGKTWIDVRAPIEFAAGTMPGAINLPLIDDDERHEIGLTYKQRGQEAAIELGHRLVSGVRRQARTDAWAKVVTKSPDAIIFCFRGGLRSQTVQQWLAQQGLASTIVSGGYKALRRCLLEAIETLASDLSFHVVCGETGAGKTEYLRQSGEPYLDLEELACHRGSAFGAVVAPQPSQADFENRLAVQLLQLAAANRQTPILIEDESRTIGRVTVPTALHQRILAGPVVRLQTPFEDRVERIFQDYVAVPSHTPELASGLFAGFRQATVAISRRLGGERAKEILADIDSAQTEFLVGGDLRLNRVWIAKLLHWYYDPLYRSAHDQRPEVRVPADCALAL